MNLQRSPSFLVVLLLLGSLFPVNGVERSFAQAGTDVPSGCISRGWPQDSSDLQPDPQLLFGALNNGFRYLIMENHEPKNRVGIYLDIQAGSLYETEDQQGLAHFLEHMLFNGTTHYPPGTLVEYFQSIGMGFGADTNAHTTYDATVYKLLLPDGGGKTLDTGLQVMADYARGALLLEKEVDRERGIIVAEKRSRDSARRRLFTERMQFSFAGTRVAERDVIGRDETLNRADARLLRDYYDAWYRPDNMILVVVGDVDPGRVEAAIRDRFSGLLPDTTQPVCPDFGRVAESGTEALYLYEPDLGYTSVTIESVWNIDPGPITRDEEVQRLKEYVAAKIMDNRLQRLVDTKGSPMTRANYYAGRLVQRLGYSSLDAWTSADNWRQTLALLETTLRQALLEGFSAGELDRVKKEIGSMLKKQVEVADSRNSRKLGEEFVSAVNDNEVIMSPAQELAFYGPFLERMSLREVNDAFQGLWHRRRLVEVMGSVDLRGEPAPEGLLLQAYRAAGLKEVQPWLQPEAATFPYLKTPEHGAEVVQHGSYPAIGVDRYLLANDVVLNLKQTDFQANEVSVAVALGYGRLSEPQPGLGMLAESVIEESGVGRLSKEQLAVVLAPYSSKVSFRVDEDSFIFTGQGLSDESELLFQLLSTHILDPAFRASAYQRSMERLVQMYGQLESSVEGVMQLEGGRFFAGGNQRYGMVPLKDMERLTLGQVEAWLAPLFAQAPLEISVVGDFDPETVLRLAGRYFGGRRANKVAVPHGDEIRFPEGKEVQRLVRSASDKALITVAWPTDDFWEISRTRRLSILASVLDDRLRKLIREELGATYSPSVYNRSSRVDPGYGVLQSSMVVDPSQAEMLAGKLRETGTVLGREGVLEGELERALEPTLTAIRDMVRTNRYWLESVLTGSSRHPQQLQWPRTIQSDFGAITAEEISALAARYLQPARAASLVILSEDENAEKKE